MKKSVSPNYLTRTMKAARRLQSRYDRMGVSSTQRIRNPLPMQKLVLSVLPKNEIVQANPITLNPAARRMLGRKVVAAIERFNAKVAKAAAPKGLTVNEIVAKLEAKGFIAPKQHVAQTLSNTKHDPFSNVGSVQAPYEGQGRRFLYFLTKP